MSAWERWIQRPQNLWLRRALFQIHLWVGIATGIYVLLISISGSAIVYRNEIYKAMSSGPKIVAVMGERFNHDQMKAAAEKAHPGYVLSQIWPTRKPNEAVEVWMRKGDGQIQRLFDPYTGKDLGPAIPYTIRTVAWFAELHTDLFYGRKGRVVNGIGSIFLTLICLSGAVIWWQGIRNWRRGLKIQGGTGWKRFNWDLHSAVGFWTFAFVFMWALTGIYVVWPTPMQKMIHRVMPLQRYKPAEFITFEQPPQVEGVQFVNVADTTPKAEPDPPPPPRRRPRLPPIPMSPGDYVVRWMTYLHFGNFAGPKTKALWTLLGLAPAVLFFTGVIMWWNRVISGLFARRSRRVVDAQLIGVEPASLAGD